MLTQALYRKLGLLQEKEYNALTYLEFETVSKLLQPMNVAKTTAQVAKDQVKDGTSIQRKGHIKQDQ